MQRIQYDSYGSPAVLRLADVELGAPRRGEVLVKVEAAAANASRGGAFLAASDRTSPAQSSRPERERPGSHPATTSSGPPASRPARSARP
jgi:hypothetical protein